MMRLPLTTILPLLLFILGSCDSLYREDGRCLVDDQNTYLSIEVANLTSNAPSIRAQGDAPSVNEDGVHYEDYIRNLAILIFDADGAKLADEVTTVPYTVMKVKPGQADLYFIANFPDADAESIRGMTTQQLDEYIQTLRPFISYEGAITPDKYFPMARVYRGQTLPEGGTMPSPKPFHPTVGSEEQLSPVSLYGQDKDGLTTQRTVNLVRSCAKVSLELKGKALMDVTKVEYYNAIQQFSFAQLDDKSAYAQIPLIASNPVLFQFYEDKDQNNGNTNNLTLPVSKEVALRSIYGHYYVPERLFAESEQPKWVKSATEDRLEGGVQYFTITLRNGLVYNIPIVFNAEMRAANQSYVDFARNGNGAVKPDFSIVRNMHYHYTISISKRLVVKIEVVPMREEILDKVYIYPTE